MTKYSNDGYDPLERLLAANADGPAPEEQLIQKTLRQARRKVGARDVLTLAVVNLWTTLARIFAPLFAIRHKRNDSIPAEEKNKHEQS